MAFTSALAWATDAWGDCLPRAARAIIWGRTNVVNTSPMAALAGPGRPMFVVQDAEVSSNLSLSAGRDPNGSLASQPLSWGTVFAKAGKLYSSELYVPAGS